MENYAYSSYPNSGNSSPLSREVDSETASFDDLNSTTASYKVKFMCSYGGKILPRPHDNQLTYVGGDTKILTVDRNLRFSSLLQRLNSLSDSDVCFKYQLPGEDLDALISVTNDEDLEHMMLEYDRLSRASVKPARLRLFLFPIAAGSAASSFGLSESKSERQWFVDALNSVQISNTEASSPVSVENPDFLFGFDKAAGHVPVAKVLDPVPAPEAVRGGTGSDCGSEDRNLIGDPAEIQRQIQELQRMQIAASQEQLQATAAAMIQRKNDIDIMNPNNRAYYGGGDYYAPPPQQQRIPQPHPVQPQYWQDQRHTTTTAGGYSVAAPAALGSESPVYLIPSTAGVYHQSQAPAIRAPAQAYYGMPRVAPEVYREQQPVYAQISAQAPPIQQQQKYTPEAIGMVSRPIPTAGVVSVADQQGYAQVAYDSAGRQVYYTTAPGVVPPAYQAVVTAADMRQGGGLLPNLDGKSVGNVKPSG